MTPGAVSGASVTFTSSASVFDSTMVGRQIWKKSSNGVGAGRAQILTYVSATQVTCKVLTAFDTVTAMAAGQWYLTTNVVSGAWHLNNDFVEVLADGGDAAPTSSIQDGSGRSLSQVINGSITLQYQASVVHLGEPYTGLIRGMALTPQSPAGNTTAKKKTVNRLGIKFLNSLGARYGTDLYNMESVEFASPSDLMGRPSPLFSGAKALVVEDGTEQDKHIYIQQVRPLPCIVQGVIPYVDTDDEG